MKSIDLIKYCVAGKEVGEGTKTPHLQMYIQLTKKLRLTALTTVLGSAGVQAHLTKANGTLAHNQTYCRKDGEWVEWGESTGKGKRSDVLALRDSVLAGNNDLQIAMDDNTCKASAQFHRFTENLRACQRAKQAQMELEASFDNKVLRPWQTTAVEALDECVLEWHPSLTGSHFVEMGTFITHTYP